MRKHGAKSSGTADHASEAAEAWSAGRAYPPPKTRPVGKWAVRVWAWSLGGLAFLSPLALLHISPRPPATQSNTPASPRVQAQAPQKRPVIIVVTKKIIERAPRPSVSYSGSSSSGGGGSYVPPAPVSVCSGSRC